MESGAGQKGYLWLSYSNRTPFVNRYSARLTFSLIELWILGDFRKLSNEQWAVKYEALLYAFHTKPMIAVDCVGNGIGMLAFGI